MYVLLRTQKTCSADYINKRPFFCVCAQWGLIPYIKIDAILRLNYPPLPTFNTRVAVKKNKAHIGISLDGDADRIAVDFLSNGFKLRVGDADKNGSGDTYIYMAFAEHPFVGDGTNPVTAR